MPHVAWWKSRVRVGLLVAATSLLVGACTDASPSAPTPSGLATGTQAATPTSSSGAAGTPGSATPREPASPSTEAAAVSAADDATTALVVCRHLVDTQTQLEVIANDALAGISQGAPDERAQPLAEGYDKAILRAEELVAAVDALELPQVPERQQLLDELRTGLAAAVVELQDERADFELAPIADDEVFGMAGRYLNGFEKTVASMETALEDYPRRQLQEAFMAEPACKFVVQPVRLDN